MKKRDLFDFLVFFSAFFAPLGSNLASFGTFNSAKFFVIFVILTIICSFFFHGFKNSFSKEFFYFLIFISIHNLITFLFLHPEDFIIGSVMTYDPIQRVITEGDGLGTAVFRFYLFMIFGGVLSNLLDSKKRFFIMCVGYIIGIIMVFMISYNNLNELRLMGTYNDPNDYAFAGLLCFFLGLFMASFKNISFKLKIISYLGLLVGMMIIFLSGTRGVCFGWAIGILYICLIKSHKRFWAYIFISLPVLFFLINLLPYEIFNSIWSRYQVDRMQDDRLAGRLDIWLDYLGIWKVYFLSGVGFFRALNLSNFLRAPHNIYLEVLIEFGIVGFLLFIWFLRSLYNLIFKDSNVVGLNVIKALLISTLIVGFSLNILTNRTTWIILAFIFAYKNILLI